MLLSPLMHVPRSIFSRSRFAFYGERLHELLDHAASVNVSRTPFARRPAGASEWSIVSTCVCCVLIASRVATALTIDADFPGGNIVVDRIDGDAILLRPDLRDTDRWWFYWAFRLRHAEGRSLRFLFAGPNPIGVRGPAVSVDGGRNWHWLGTKTVSNTETNASFSYQVGSDQHEVRFAFAFPYQEANLRRFLQKHAGHRQLHLETLCETVGGTPIELVRITPTFQRPAYRILLTARHHACESMASYVLEGLLDAVLADSPAGAWLRKHTEIAAIPFVDKLGVEAGDQGKNRRPHDHWVDYSGESRYRSIAALRAFAAAWGHHGVDLAIDFHCPYLRGSELGPGNSQQIFFMGSRRPEVERQAERLQQIFKTEISHPFSYDLRNNLPFGTRWNAGEVAANSFLGWAEQLPGIRAATVIEIPYADIAGHEVNDATARRLGSDLARTIRRYLAEQTGRVASPR